ncbi:DegV family protein [Mycoplasmopsis opalescens]|uniref:DegV family protein n=1 Tax=Mycoplasmopsis opalescens TaxID=114886 RepID=UPI0004A73E7B|nr:DegV family protein [Mycoplasmopsis opalescens]
MKKLTFIFDSFVFHNNKEIEALGYHFIPLKVIVDDKVYEDGLNNNAKEMLQIYENAKSIKTSLPNIGKLEELVHKLSEEYDDIVYLPISSALSSTYSVSKVLEKEYPKFHVIDSCWASDMLLEGAKIIQKIYDKDQHLNNVENVLDKIKKESLMYVLLGDVEYFIRGGRVGGLKKFTLNVLSKLRIYPFVKFHYNMASVAGLMRTMKKGVQSVINKMQEFAFKTKKNIKKIQDYFKIFIVEGNDKAVIDTADSELSKIEASFDARSTLYGAVAAHTGPGAIAIALFPSADKFTY